MKKKSRFLTGLLSAVMALSLFALPASAAATTTAPGINTNQQGSITIHKYLMEDTSKANQNPNAEDDQTVPESAEPVDGVGFTIYRVMDTDELLAYYNGDSKKAGKAVTVKDYVKIVDGATKVYKNDTEVKAFRDEVKTNTVDGVKGIAQFKNLPVGLYVVVETTKLASVTAAVEPFLVSIPMTRMATDTANKEWLYDVVVYPKNSTKKGSVDLVKKGATGDKNDQNATNLNDVEFDLYWYDDAKNEWVPKQSGLKTADKKNDTDEVIAAGVITVDNLQTGKYKFVEKSNSNHNYITDLNETYEFEIDASGKLKLPESVSGTTNTNDYTISGSTLTVYNYKPDLDKEVLKRDADATEDKNWVEGADYNVGDSVPYRITVTVPSNITKLSQFEVSDTPNHLTDDTNSIQITAANGETVTKEVHYTVEPAGKGFVIKFVPDEMSVFAGTKLTITYNATLDTDAVTSVDGNTNTAKLVYTNNIKEDGTPNKDSHEEIHDETIVYTFAIDIVKISDQKDINGNPEKLEGVKFNLYKKVDAETTDSVKGSTIGIDDENANADFVKLNADNDPLTTDSNGKVSKPGLANGTYYLVEIETKTGYNLLKAPVKVELNIQYKETWDESKEYLNGVLTKNDVNVKREKYFNNDKTKTNGSVETTIVNRKGFDLPVTGGFGTLLFSGIGALLVVGGVGVLMSTKKKKGNT